MINQKKDRISVINELYSKTILVMSTLIVLIGYMIYDIYEISIYNYYVDLLIITTLAIGSYIHKNEFYKKILIYSLFVFLFVYHIILFGLSFTDINYYLIQFVILVSIFSTTAYVYFIIRKIDFNYMKDSDFDNNYLPSLFYRKNIFFNKNLWYVMSGVIFSSIIIYFFSRFLACFMYTSFLMLCLLSFYSFFIFTVVYSYELEKYHPN